MAVQLYIQSLSLDNFRGFKREPNIPLSKLTFLVGPNSSGKSSLFAAMSLLAQSRIFVSNPLQSSIIWSGRLVDVGSFSDAVYAHNTHLQIKIALEFSTNPSSFYPWRERSKKTTAQFPVRLSVTIRPGGGKDKLGHIHKMVLTDVTSGATVQMILMPKIGKSQSKLTIELLGQTHTIPGNLVGDNEFDAPAIKNLLRKTVKLAGHSSGASPAAWKRLIAACASWHLSFFFQSTQRVSSGRSGPQRLYPLTGNINMDETPFGQARYEAVDPALIERSMRVDSRRRTKKEQSRKAQFEQFLENLQIASSVKAHPISPYHNAISVTDSQTRVESHLIDVGYGASQVIPVLAACQSDSVAPLLIEQPEIHLHPRAQGHVADLLIETSKSRQVFVETHSVHIINRARLLVAQKKLSTADVSVIYVDRRKGGSFVHMIPILSDGEFGAEWPDGFFEERYRETLSLMEAKERS